MQNDRLDAQNDALTQQGQAVDRTRLARQQGQQASMQGGGREGRIEAAIRLALEAMGHALGYKAAEGESHPTKVLNQGGCLPYEVFKGLMDALVRVSEGIVLRGHTDPVTAVAYSPDSEQVATASKDTTARVWNARTSAPLHTLEGHEGPVQSVAWSPDGTRLATASDDKTIRLWEVATGKALTNGKLNHTGPVQSVAWSPDGMRIATASGSMAWVWHMNADAIVVPLVGHEGTVESVAFSPDGTQLATAGEDETVRVWNVDSGVLTRTFEGHEGPVTRCGVLARWRAYRYRQPRPNGAHLGHERRARSLTRQSTMVKWYGRWRSHPMAQPIGHGDLR